jgi:putative membrane protein
MSEAGGSAAAPASNAPVSLSNELALERTYLASERTLMAWIRTALSMISFGFTLGKLGEALQDVKIRGLLHESTYSVKNIAYFLVILGTLSLAGALVQHYLRIRSMYVIGLAKTFSIPFASGTLLFFVGLFALTGLVWEL